MSMAGMINTVLILCSEMAEIGENAQPDLLALLRMELAGKKMIRRNTGDKVASIVGRRRHNRSVCWNNIKGMHKVNVDAVRDAFEERRLAFFLDAVPTHVRNLEAIVQVKADDFPGEEIETLLSTELLALREQQLEPEAYSQERF